MSLLDLLILMLAAWRTAYFVAKESGPFAFMDTLRARWHTNLLTCVYCASFWTGLLCWLLWQTPLQPAVVVFAISGGALMLASYTGVGVGQN